jgi:hypothetical protein
LLTALHFKRSAGTDFFVNSASENKIKRPTKEEFSFLDSVEDKKLFLGADHEKCCKKEEVDFAKIIRKDDRI